jgi:(2S)-methylsuccinyl-CoA dehydrogenase
MGVSETVGDTAAARRCLGNIRNLLDWAWGKLRSRCDQDGAFDPVRLDEHQVAAYELAFCAAELGAAEALCEYADRAGGHDGLALDVARAFAGEMLQPILHRLAGRAEDIGLARSEVLALYGEPAIEAFLAAHAGSERLVAIADELYRRGSRDLPDLLGEENAMVRQTFARFADEVVAPVAQRIHRNDEDVPDELLQAATEMGCFGTSIPERFGGLQPDNGADSLGMIVVTEELSRGSLGAVGSLITRPEIAARALLNGGTEAQQEEWLPKLAYGESLCAIAITEPDYGSDVASLAVKATPTDGGWLLNGAKTWSTFAGKANLIVVVARSETDPALGHKGLSLFLVEKPSFPGHQFEHSQPSGGKISGKAIPTIGYRGMHSFDLFFEDYFVPEDGLLGGEQGRGRGFYYTMAGFSGGRLQTAARANGVMLAAFDQAMKYAAERKVFGKPLSAYPLTGAKLGRLFATLTASRQFSYAVARQMDAGGGQMEASLAKLFSCRAAETVTREAQQIHGGMGYAEESEVSRHFVDARVLPIFEGAEETLALKVVARNLVGKAQPA